MLVWVQKIPHANLVFFSSSARIGCKKRLVCTYLSKNIGRKDYVNKNYRTKDLAFAEVCGDVRSVIYSDSRNSDYRAFYFDENGKSPLIEGYSVVASDNVPTCRNNDIEWDEEKTYKCVVDGFIVSNNIEIVTHYNVETKNGNKGIDGFAYSDHQPAYIEFKLK